MDAILELLHDPLAHRPLSHVLAMSGIEMFDELVTTTLKNVPKFRHWASGAISTPCNVVLHDDDKVLRMLVTPVNLGFDHRHLLKSLRILSRNELSAYNCHGDEDGRITKHLACKEIKLKKKRGR
jgi:hypothetical protein